MSHTIMFKLCKSIADFQGLKELNLSGNHLPYFCIDALCNNKRLPAGLRLSDTRLDDLSAYQLTSKLVKSEIGVMQLDISRNPLLSYPFYQKLADLLKRHPGSILKTIDMRYCTISDQCLTKIGKLLTKKTRIASDISDFVPMNRSIADFTMEDILQSQEKEPFSQIDMNSFSHPDLNSLIKHEKFKSHGLDQDLPRFEQQPTEGDEEHENRHRRYISFSQEQTTVPDCEHVRQISKLDIESSKSPRPSRNLQFATASTHE